MIEAGDPTELRTKRKVVATLLPYAIWQERSGQPEMLLNAFLHAAGASGVESFLWDCVPHTLFLKGTPRAIVLLSPHVPWSQVLPEEGLTQQWIAAASAVEYTEEVAQGVVETLLLITSEERLLPLITIDVWSWLTKRPYLHPACWGRHHGSCPRVVKAVRGLRDLEILKSYFLLVWSEWDLLYCRGFDEMCISLHEDFGGVGMGHHRADFIQRLDQILGQLDQGLERLRMHAPRLNVFDFQMMKDQYGKLMDILLEMNVEAVLRMSYLTVKLPCIMT